jgi:hypothetical protein
MAAAGGRRLAVPSLMQPLLWLGGAGALVVLIDAMISRFSAKVEIFDGIPQGAVAPTLLWCGVVVFLPVEVRRFSF